MTLFLEILLIILPIFFATYAIKIYKYIEKQAQVIKIDKSILNSVLNSTSNGILICSFDNKILSFNDMFSNMWGLPNDFSSSNFTNTKLIEFLSTKLKNSYETKKYIDKKIKLKIDLEYSLELNDDRIIKLCSSPLIVDNDFIGRVYNFKDITKEANTTKIIEKSTQQYEKLIDFLPAGILVHIKGRILFCNNSFYNILRIDKKIMSLQNKNILDFVHEDDKILAKKRINEVQKENKIPKPLEEKLLRVDGSIAYVLALTTPYLHNGEITSLVVFQDITERKQSEALKKEIYEKQKLLDELRHYSELQSQFFSNLSHEFRTPINVLYSSLQLMSSLIQNYDENNLNELGLKMNTYISSMKNNCFRLMKLVNNLIDITKLKSGYLKVYMHNEDIVNIVEHIVLSSSKYIEQNGLSVVFDTDVEEKVVACDSYFLERIVLNLLSNSTKFTPRGGKISVNIHDKINYLTISVKDTGIGIPQYKQAMIFEPFTQIDKSLTRNREGSGVGLYIVKSLVELLGGEITVNSSPGKGSEFIIKLPSFTIYQPTSNLKTRLDYGNIDTVNNIKIEFSDIY